MFLINKINGRFKAYEEWCLDVYDNFITQETFDNLVECDYEGNLL